MSEHAYRPIPYLVKLVRDRIGQHLVEDTVRYEPITDRETAVKLLRQKLIEEAVEYALDPSIGELADVMEVLGALARFDLQVPWFNVLAETSRKHDARGGFEELMGMWCATSAGEWS